MSADKCKTENGAKKEKETANAISVFDDNARRAYISLLVGLRGLGPPTSRLSGVCSNLLSYKPKINFAKQN